MKQARRRRQSRPGERPSSRRDNEPGAWAWPGVVGRRAAIERPLPVGAAAVKSGQEQSSNSRRASLPTPSLPTPPLPTPSLPAQSSRTYRRLGIGARHKPRLAPRRRGQQRPGQDRACCAATPSDGQWRSRGLNRWPPSLTPHTPHGWPSRRTAPGPMDRPITPSGIGCSSRCRSCRSTRVGSRASQRAPLRNLGCPRTGHD